MLLTFVAIFQAHEYHRLPDVWCQGIREESQAREVLSASFSSTMSKQLHAQGF